MEKHLAGCASCLEAYLATIGEGEAEAAGSLLSPGFSRQMSNSARQSRPPAAPASPRALLTRYTAAAAATLLLTAGGAFDWAARDLCVALEKTQVFSQAIAGTAGRNWSDY